MTMIIRETPNGDQHLPVTGATPPGQFALEGESDEPLGLIVVVPFGSVFCTVPGSGLCGQ